MKRFLVVFLTSLGIIYFTAACRKELIDRTTPAIPEVAKKFDLTDYYIVGKTGTSVERSTNTFLITMLANNYAQLITPYYNVISKYTYHKERAELAVDFQVSTSSRAYFSFVVDTVKAGITAATYRIGDVERVVGIYALHPIAISNQYKNKRFVGEQRLLSTGATTAAAYVFQFDKLIEGDYEYGAVADPSLVASHYEVINNNVFRFMDPTNAFKRVFGYVNDGLLYVEERDNKIIYVGNYKEDK